MLGWGINLGGGLLKICGSIVGAYLRDGANSRIYDNCKAAEGCQSPQDIQKSRAHEGLGSNVRKV